MLDRLRRLASLPLFTLEGRIRCNAWGREREKRRRKEIKRRRRKTKP
jgi:hypothetical protein